jgi:hypothetical protein
MTENLRRRRKSARLLKRIFGEEHWRGHARLGWNIEIEACEAMEVLT